MTGHWVSPVEHDWTCPVVISHFWMFTGNDRTLRSSVRSLRSSASGHHLTVEIGRTTFEERDTWHASCDWTLRSSIWSPRVVPSEGVQRLYFLGASI